MAIINDVTLASRIREARLAAGLTQQQLADFCGVSMQAVSAWEKGRAKTITGPHLFCLADVLRVDARWLATGIAKDQKPQTIYSGIVRDIEALPAEKQELVLQLIRSISGTK